MKNRGSSKKKGCMGLVALGATVMPGATLFRQSTTSANEAKVLQPLVRPVKTSCLHGDGGVMHKGMLYRWRR